jgi:Spy/CpxP family protein refolding chaperone
MDSGAGRVLALLLRPDTLSEAQEQQVHAIMEADRGTVHDTLDKLKSVNEQMAAALLADPAPTSEALAALTDEVTALRKTLVAQQVETALAVRAVLTPEQLADAEARRQQIAARAGDEAFPDQP